jgi:hypothetical protein
MVFGEWYSEPLVSRRYLVTLKLFPGAVTGAAQVVRFWAIPQQSAGSVNSYLRGIGLDGKA